MMGSGRIFMQTFSARKRGVSPVNQSRSRHHVSYKTFYEPRQARILLL